MDIFICPRENEAFLEIDVRELRSEKRSVQIPPPGWLAPPVVFDVDTVEDENKYSCGIVVAGNKCNASFNTVKQLSAHIKATHNAKSLFNIIL